MNKTLEKDSIATYILHYFGYALGCMFMVSPSYSSLLQSITKHDNLPDISEEKIPTELTDTVRFLTNFFLDDNNITSTLPTSKKNEFIRHEGIVRSFIDSHDKTSLKKKHIAQNFIIPIIEFRRIKVLFRLASKETLNEELNTVLVEEKIKFLHNSFDQIIRKNMGKQITCLIKMIEFIQSFDYRFSYKQEKDNKYYSEIFKKSEKRIKSLIEKRDNLKTKFNDAKKENNNLVDEVEKLNIEFTNTKSEYEKKINELNSKISQYQNSAKSYNLELTSRKSEYEKKINELNLELTNRSSEAEKENNSLKEKIAQLKNGCFVLLVFVIVISSFKAIY